MWREDETVLMLEQIQEKKCLTLHTPVLLFKSGVSGGIKCKDVVIKEKNIIKLVLNLKTIASTGEQTDKLADIGQLQGWLVISMNDFSLEWLHTKVQVGNDQEKAQSEKDSYSKNRGGKKLN